MPANGNAERASTEPQNRSLSEIGPDQRPDIAPIVTSILSHRYPKSLDKINDRDSYKGRTRLIKDLSQQIAAESDPVEIRRLKRQKAYLERAQYNSRVMPGDKRPRRGRY